MKKEIYRLDIKIGVKGDSEAKKKLTATEKFAQQSEKRMKTLDRVKASPSVKLQDKLSKPLSSIESKISRFSKAAVKKLAAVATAGALIAGGLGLSSTMKAYTDFEQGLANVKAISGATAQEMQILSKEARRLGAETAWSAKQVTDAETLLSQAGFKVNETVAALPGLLDMASAGTIDLSVATDIAAGTLRAFGLEASKSAHVADVLALTASRTNSDITGLGESLKYVAPVSKALGVSLEETGAALGMLADANIKGSQSGTVLRAAFSRLANPPRKAAKMINKLGFEAFDASGKMLPLDKVIGNLQKSMKGLTEKQKAQAVSTIFGVEAMSGMLALVEQGPEKLKRLTTELEKSDGAAKKMANTKLDSLQGQITILQSATEGMKIELGERLAPYAKQFVTWFTAKIPDITNKIMEIADKISNLGHKFSQLSPATKKSIGYLALGVVFFAPLSAAITGITKGITGLIGIGGKLGRFFGIFKGATVAAEATTAAAAGTEVAAGSVAGLGIAAKASAILLSPWTWGIGAATVAGVKLYRHLKKDSIPAVQLFGEETSKATKEAIGAYTKLDDEVRKKLMSFRFSNKKISKEASTEVVKNFNSMGIQIKNGIDKHFNEAYETMQKLFTNSKILSEKEETEILAKMRNSNEAKKAEIDRYEKEINTILDNISKGKVANLDQAYAKIDVLQGKMKESAVKNLSDTEIQSKVILERMKAQQGTITAEQAAEVVRNSYAQKTKAIKDAEEQYNSRIAWIIRERDEYGTITEEQAAKLIGEADRQKTEAINKASEMHSTVVEHARQQAGEHAAQVEWETGQVKSNFDVMIEKIKEFNALPIKEKVITITQKINSWFEKQNNSGMGTYQGPGSVAGIGKAYASGTNYAASGVHEVAEHGFEIVTNRQFKLFNGGEKVFNNRESKNILGSTYKGTDKTKENPKPQFAVAQPQLAGAGGINVYVGDVGVENNFDSDVDVDEIVRATTKEVGIKLKEALKNTKK